MKKLILSVIAAAALATPALAADLKMALKAPPPPPSPWDIAFGAALMSDYNFRGISQSNRGPSVTAYSETRYNVDKDLQLYAGSQYWAVTLPTNPTCECDFYGGIRPTFGPLALDFGVIYYYYPKETQHAGVPGAQFPAFPNGNSTLNDTDYWEVYAKGTYTVNDKLSFGFNEFYSPSWLHTGAYGNYFSGVFKAIGPSFNLPMYGASREIGWYVSGELGGYWFGTTNLVLGVFNPAAKLPNYATWNLGMAFTWSVFTLDLRYYDTNLSKEDCNILTGDPNASFGGTPSAFNTNGLKSNWCSAAFIVTGKFDLTLASLSAAMQK
jgi:uncharacterized protein (TIGR02001 family)